MCIVNELLHDNRRPALADGVEMAITERAYEQGGLLVAAPPGRHISGTLGRGPQSLIYAQPQLGSYFDTARGCALHS